MCVCIQSFFINNETNLFIYLLYPEEEQKKSL